MVKDIILNRSVGGPRVPVIGFRMLSRLDIRELICLEDGSTYACVVQVRRFELPGLVRRGKGVKEVITH